jgi:prolyl oligopeptidase PreP (S9A serine peptidase family)
MITNESGSQREDVDPYLWLEHISSKKVIAWALKRDAIFRRKLKPRFPKLLQQIAKYYNERSIIQVKVSKKSTFFLERRPEGYIIRSGKRIIANSRSLGGDYVFLSFYTDGLGERLAYLASKGEDYGLARIIDVQSRQLVSELRGDLGDLVFLRNGDFYYVKIFKGNEKTPDGENAPACRVMKGKRMVFGKGVPSGEFISVKESNGYALITVGSWGKNEIYAGRINEPQSWTHFRRRKFCFQPDRLSSGKKCFDPGS